MALKLASDKMCIKWEILSIHNLMHILHQGAKHKEEQSKIDLVSLTWTFAFSSVNIQHARNLT